MTDKKENSAVDQYEILIVDDDEHFRTAHKRLMSMIRLTDIGAFFTIRETGNQEDALNIVRENSIDCVMLDYLMPDGNGLDYMKKMLELNPDLTVIIVTGAGSEEIAVKAMKAGAMDYLVKGSISLESLERSVVNAVKRSRMLKEIEVQRKQLMEAERYRVMTSSIAAACHHLGQPATVLRTSIVAMRRQEHAHDMDEMLRESFIAVEKICSTLFKLRNIASYNDEPYLADSTHDSILRIE